VCLYWGLREEKGEGKTEGESDWKGEKRRVNMSILTKPSTRTHAPPGGQSSWSKSGDYTGDAKKVAAATNAPYQAPMQTGTRIAIACLTGCALVLPAVSSLEAAGAQVVQIAVHEPMQLPFAVQTLLVAPVKPSSILVVGDMPESHWCSANVVEVVLSAILKLGLDNGIPVTCGINFEKSSNIAMDGKKHAAAALHAASLRETPPIASAQIVTASPEVDHPPSVFAVPPSVGKMPPDIKHMMDTFRSGLKHHGAKGIFGLGRKFRIADDNGNGKLSKEEFAKCVKELKLALSEEQTAAIFSHFDADCSGGIDYEEFIVGVRGIMNERRSQLVLAAFKILDVDASGTLELSDVKGKYNAKQHPDVLAGRRLEDEILAEFINTFEGNKGNRDGIVTVKEWLDYYSMLSASVDEGKCIFVFSMSAIVAPNPLMTHR
jgi:Ca2+-binding EF-hand superfamily protein